MLSCVGHVVERTGEPIVMAIDGVDESPQGALLISEVVGPLLTLRLPGGQPMVYCVSGLRSSRHLAAGPRPGSLHDLMRRVAATSGFLEIRTDGPEARFDVSEYLRAFLATPPRGLTTTPYASREDAHRMADFIASQPGITFLDARLIAERLRFREVVQDTSDPEWLATLKDGSIGRAEG